MMRNFFFAESKGLCLFPDFSSLICELNKTFGAEGNTLRQAPPGLSCLPCRFWDLERGALEKQGVSEASFLLKEIFGGCDVLSRV